LSELRRPLGEWAKYQLLPLFQMTINGFTRKTVPRTLLPDKKKLVKRDVDPRYVLLDKNDDSQAVDYARCLSDLNFPARTMIVLTMCNGGAQQFDPNANMVGRDDHASSYSQSSASAEDAKEKAEAGKSKEGASSSDSVTALSHTCQSKSYTMWFKEPGVNFQSFEQIEIRTRSNTDKLMASLSQQNRHFLCINYKSPHAHPLIGGSRDGKDGHRSHSQKGDKNKPANALTDSISIL